MCNTTERLSLAAASLAHIPFIFGGHMAYSFGAIFVLLMLIGLPIAFALIGGSIGYFYLADKMVFLQNLAQKLIGGVNQFPLLAIPLFILAGEIMNQGKITAKLIDFSNALVGHWRGGLAQVLIATNVMFAGLSGSAAAGAAVLGSTLIPAMEKNGYSRNFAAAVTAASAIEGPIIPPSIMCILYAFTMQVSVISLFVGAIVPGLILGGGLMLCTRLIADWKKLPPARPRAPFSELTRTFWGAFLPLLTPVIILGGTMGGVFTATEAAAVAAAYALLLSLFVFRTIVPKDLWGIFRRAMISSSVILFIVSCAFVFAWTVTLSGLPSLLATWAVSVTDNKYLLLLIINVALLIVGMFLDAGPAVLIVAPILGPTAVQFGIDPVHFGLIICINLCVGLATPPMGLVLFVASSVAKISMGAMLKDMIPYWVVHVLVLLIITYVPAVTLFLPKFFGL